MIISKYLFPLFSMIPNFSMKQFNLLWINHVNMDWLWCEDMLWNRSRMDVCIHVGRHSVKYILHSRTAFTTAFATVAVRGATIFSRNTKSSSRRSAMHSLASAGGASKVIQPSTATWRFSSCRATPPPNISSASCGHKSPSERRCGGSISRLPLPSAIRKTSPYKSENFKSACWGLASDPKCGCNHLAAWKARAVHGGEKRTGEMSVASRR